MSQKADIFAHFSNDLYKQRMTVEERAQLMVDLYCDLGYDDYDMVDENGHWCGYNIQLAIDNLNKVDRILC